VAVRTSEDPERHAERLIGLVTAAFAEAGWARNGVDLVACGVGPGSFTGIRIGMAAAKGLALAWDRPIVGVGSLEAMAAALPDQARGVDGIAALLDARKREVFLAVYGPEGDVLAPPSHIALERVAATLSALDTRKLVAVGEAAVSVELGAVPVYRSEWTDLPDARTIARLAALRMERTGPDDVAALEPLYVRPPDITLPGR
jgi:tRNA threonylcarbamoyladenosine biosynthesis protein TsaB